MYAQVNYTGSAAVQNYTITFPSLAQSHLVIVVDGVTLVNGVGYTINSARTTLTLIAAVVGGEVIAIRRVTPKGPNDALVDWQNGSTIADTDLDTAYLQNLYIAEEAFDAASNCLPLTTDGTNVWTAGSKELTNLGAPVGDNSAWRKIDATNQSLASGNLPPVTGADNDKSLWVVAGAWAVRTVAQARAILALGTAALLDVGTTASKVVQLDGSARLPAVDGRNLTNLHLAADTFKQPATYCSFADATLLNNSSATWKTDTSGTLGRFDLTPAGETNDATGVFSADGTTDLFTLQAGNYSVELHLVVANTDGAAVSGTVDLAITTDTGGAVWSSTPVVLNIKPGSCTYGAPYVVNWISFFTAFSATSFAVRGRQAGTTGVKLIGDGSYVIFRKVS